MRLHDHALLGLNRALIRRPDCALLRPGNRLMPRLCRCARLWLRDRARRRRAAGTAQLIHAAAVTLLETGVIGTATTPQHHPRILLLVEPGPRGSRPCVVLPGIGGAQLLVEAAEPRVAADQLFVRSCGVPAIEALGICPRGGA